MAPPLGTWIANNTAPRARRATGLALFAMLANAGGVLATWLYGPLSPAPPAAIAVWHLEGLREG